MQFKQIDISHKEITILTLTQSLLSLQNSKTQSYAKKASRNYSKSVKKLEVLGPKGLNHELNWLMLSDTFFSVQLDFIPKCIPISKLTVMDNSQRFIKNLCSVWDEVFCKNSLQLQAFNCFHRELRLKCVEDRRSASDNARVINDLK